MNQKKIGELIRAARREHGFTQQELAARMHISDKTISKWECGLGCPDLSLLPQLSEILGLDLSALLDGQLPTRRVLAGNMKKLLFYICPTCGNLITASGKAQVSCCGKKLLPLTPQKASDSQTLTLEKLENEWHVISDHPMTKDHSIAFVTLLTGDTVVTRKLYPEWNMETRLPYFRHGILVWYCNQHGLFYQNF